MDDRGFDTFSRHVFAVTRRRGIAVALANMLAVFTGWTTGRPDAAAQSNPTLCGPQRRACRGRCIPEQRCCRTTDCRAGQRCQRGRCRCKFGHRRCGKRCFNFKNSKQHCGTCGNTCAGTATCRKGACVAGGSYRFVRQIDGAGTLEYPSGITVDQAGLLYVTSRAEQPGNGFVTKFTGNGGLITTWSSLGEGPQGIAITPGGTIYVVNGESNNNVKSFSRTGTPGPNFELDTESFGLALSLSGDLYIAQYLVDSVVRYAATGAVLPPWTNPPEFDAPFWVAVAPNGDVYVTAELSHDVTWLTADGEFKGRWTEGDGPFDWPFGITVDAAGFVYVVDRGNPRVQKFTADGTFIGTIGSNTMFTTPIDVAVSRTGMLYVTDFNARAILQFVPA